MSHPEDDILGVFDSAPFRAEWTSDGHVTEESLHAWLDGALGVDESGVVGLHATTCRTCEAALAEARGLIAASMRIMHEADVSPRDIVPRDDVMRTSARVVASADRAHPSPARRSRVRTLAQIAAGLLVMISGATYVGTRDQEPSALARGTSAVASAPGPLRDTVSAPQGAATAEPPVAEPARAGTAAPTVSVPPRAPTAAALRALSSARASLANAPTFSGDSNASVLAKTAAAPPVRSVIASTTITGRVMDGAVPLGSARVSIPGTTVGTITDSLGRYTLRDVPSTATTLRAQRIGYEAVTRPIADTLQTMGVDFTLEPSNFALSAVVVTSMRSTGETRDARCFISAVDSTAGRAPIVRMLRGTMRDAGTHTLILVGWPAAGELTEGTFSLDSAGRLTGRASVNRSIVEFELDGDGRSWFGTVIETRGVNIRRDDVEFVADTSARRCSRSE